MKMRHLYHSGIFWSNFATKKMTSIRIWTCDLKITSSAILILTMFLKWEVPGSSPVQSYTKVIVSWHFQFIITFFTCIFLTKMVFLEINLDLNPGLFWEFSFVSLETVVIKAKLNFFLKWIFNQIQVKNWFLDFYRKNSRKPGDSH